MRYLHYTIILLIGLTLLACTHQEIEKPLRVGFNTWPGYEFIYLAEVKGFYEKQGVKVKLVELGALGDVRRAFERGQIDIMASTMVEVLIAAENTGREIKLIAATDTSNGSDMLLAKTSIKSLKELKNRRIGMEGATVDIVVASEALQRAQLTFQDVTLITQPQDELVEKFKAGKIDALQTYPPYSVSLLKSGLYHKLFDTSQAPGLIVDTLSVDAEVLKNRRSEIRKFLHAFFEASEYHKAQPKESNAIMGKRERLSGEEFAEAIGGMTIISKNQQKPYLIEKGLGGKALTSVAKALHSTGWLKNEPQIETFFDPNITDLTQ